MVVTSFFSVTFPAAARISSRKEADMLEFMRAGGYAMWVILVVGGTSLGLAVSFVVRPSERKLAVFRPLAVSVLFLTLSGLFSGLGATMHNVTTNPRFADSPELHKWVMMGIGESTANAILGFSLLALAWLVVAVGMRRQA
jgi:heme exporter protein D